MRRTDLAVLTVSFALVVGAASAQAQTAAPTSGREIYRVRCAMCHGALGRGDGSMGGSMNPRPSNLTVQAERTALTDATMATTILNGRREMPSFARLLTPQQVDSVVAYVRTLQR